MNDNLFSISEVYNKKTPLEIMEFFYALKGYFPFAIFSRYSTLSFSAWIKRS